MKTPSVVPADISHLPEIMEIYRLCVEEMNARGLFNWNNEYPSEEDIRRDIQNKDLFIFTENANPLAAVCLNEDEPPEYRDLAWKYPSPALFVHRLAVHPRKRKQKIAETMMLHAHRFAKENNYLSMRLDVLMKNLQATKLYKKLAYENAGIIHFSYLEDPFMCMEKNLAEF